MQVILSSLLLGMFPSLLSSLVTVPYDSAPAADLSAFIPNRHFQVVAMEDAVSATLIPDGVTSLNGGIERWLDQRSTSRGALLPASSSTLLLSTINADTNEIKTQYQQMGDAMVLKTLQGTQWRIQEFPTTTSTFWKPNSSKTTPRSIRTSYVRFEGFSSEPNKGTAYYESSLPSIGDDGTTPLVFTSSGPWLTKPSEIRKGAVQLSARWKVKTFPEGSKIIYKGFIRAGATYGAGGSTMEAEIQGTMLDSTDDSVIGTFQGDLIGPSSAGATR